MLMWYSKKSMQFVKILMIFWHCVIHFLLFAYVIIGSVEILIVLITMVIDFTEIRTDLVGKKPCSKIVKLVVTWHEVNIIISAIDLLFSLSGHLAAISAALNFQSMTQICCHSTQWVQYWDDFRTYLII